MTPRVRILLRKVLVFYLTRQDASMLIVVGVLYSFSLLASLWLCSFFETQTLRMYLVWSMIASAPLFIGLVCFLERLTSTKTPSRSVAVDQALSLIAKEKMKAERVDLWWPLPVLVVLAYDRPAIAESDRAHLEGQTPMARGKSRPTRL